MKPLASKVLGWALVLSLLLTACGRRGAEAPSFGEDPPSARGENPDSASGYVPSPPEIPEEKAASSQPSGPEDAALAEEIAPALSRLEETDWQIVSADAEAFHLTGGFDNPEFEYVFHHTGSVPLDRLIAFSLEADAAGEGASCELRDRFVEAPNAVLSYLVLMGDQTTELPGWEPMPTAELVCRFIASADGAWYDDHEPFTQTLASCREAYPEGITAKLLDVLEREHAAAIERNIS